MCAHACSMAVPVASISIPRPWSPVTPDPDSPCVTGTDGSQLAYSAENIFVELARARPTSLCPAGTNRTDLSAQVPQDPRLRPAVTPTPSPVTTTPQTPSPTTPLSHQHPYLNDPRMVHQRPASITLSASQMQPHEPSPQTPTPTTTPYQNGRHHEVPDNVYFQPTSRNQLGQYCMHNGRTNASTVYGTPVPSTPSPPASTVFLSSPFQSPDCDYTQLVDIEVILKANAQDIQLYGKHGVVRRVSSGANRVATAYVIVYNTRQEIGIPCVYLQVVCPRQFDAVKVLSGLNKGSVGQLRTVTNSTGIVQLLSSCGQAVPNLIQFPLNQLGKYVPQTPSQILSRGGMTGNGFVQNSMSSSPFLLTNGLYQCRNGFPAYQPQTLGHTQGGNGYWTGSNNHLYSRPPPPYGKTPNPAMKADCILKPQKLQLQRMSVDKTVADKSVEQLLEALLKKPSPTFNFSRAGEWTSDLVPSLCAGTQMFASEFLSGAWVGLRLTLIVLN